MAKLNAMALACRYEISIKKNIIVDQDKGYKKLMVGLRHWHMTRPEEKNKKERVIL